MTKGLKQRFYPESKFGGFTDADGTIVFYNRIRALAHPTSVVVDYGCGRGQSSDDPVGFRRDVQVLKGKVRKVIGLDVDAGAAGNPKIDEFHLLKGSAWPLEDDSIDLCISDSVLEHLEDPELFFKECHRVLKNDGFLCLKTPNSMSYVGLASRLIPNRFHASVLKRVQENRNAEDVFPTLYRCNTIGKLRKLLHNYGFEHVVYGYEAEPTYLEFSRIAYWLGTIHEKFSPGYLRQGIFAFGRLRKLRPQSRPGVD